MKKLGIIIGLCWAFIQLPAQEDEDIFNIYFSQDFEHNTLGIYRDDEWAEDWNYPSWSNRQIPPQIIQDTNTENGSKVIRFTFPEGCLGPREGGGQWYTNLNNSFNEIYFSYKVKFKPGFEWVLSGKLAGVVGGPQWDGFEAPGWSDGFVAKITWNYVPRLVFYYYHQDQSHTYGDSKAWYYNPSSSRGFWKTLTFRIVMNTIGENGGNYDGIFEGFVDGELVSQVTGIRLRNVHGIGVDHIQIAPSFGGGSDDFRAIRDEWIDFDDFVIFDYKDGVDVTRGNVFSPSDRVLIVPGGDYEPPPMDTTPKIRVNASGTQYNGEYAHFKLLVNKEFIDETYVTSSEKAYTFYLDNPVSDDDTIYIVFDNDLFIEGEADINLFVSSINVNNKTYYPDNNNVVFVYERDVLEGNDIKYGTGNVTWGGQLVFFLGETEVVLDDVYPLLKEDSTLNEPPVIADKSILIADNLPDGSTIGTITATDPNRYQEITFSIVGGNSDNVFEIDSSDGQLSVFNSIGLKSVDIFNLLIEAKDDGEGNLSDTGMVTINIQHIDTTVSNNPPVISNQEFNIRESDDLNSKVMQIDAFEPDIGQNMTYTILSGNQNSAFYLHSSSGQLSINDKSKLNFEEETKIDLSVQVQDDGDGFLLSSAIVTINLIPDITTFYIDPGNTNDPSEDGSVNHPYDSWADISWKEGNTYLQKRGTTANEDKINIYADDVTLGAYGQGERPVINSSASDFAIRAFEKTGVTIQDLKIVADEAISCIYFLGSSCDNNMVENCYLEGADNGLRIIDGKTITLRYNTFSNNDDAIYSYAETTEIYYNVFKENETGVNISSYLSNTKIYNNVFYDNSRAVSTSYSSLTIYNNIFYLMDKGDEAINHKLDNLVSDNNIFYPEQEGFLDINNTKYSSLYDYQQSKGLDLNSFTSDPLFKDVYNNNFGVEPESPAIDGGRDVGLMMDFNGYSVPHGRMADIGLIESMDENIVSSVDPFGFGGEDEAPLVFPNPSDGRFKISFTNMDFMTSELHIKDMAGNLIFRDYIDSDDIDPTALIDISDAPKGIYLLTLAIDDRIYTQRVVIN